VKILLGSSLYEPNIIGGAERVVQLLATSLRTLGHEVAVITTQPAGPAMQATLNGVSVHYVPVRNLYRPFAGDEPGILRKIAWRTVDSYNVWMTKAIGKIIDLEKPDVLNTHNLTGLSVAIWTAAHRRHVPIVHTLHDQYLLCHRGTMFKPPRNCVRRCIDCRLLTAPRKHQAKLVGVVVGVSKFILERHQRFGYFESAETKVIYNSALRHTPEFNAPRPARGRLRFGYLGQIIPSKGVHALIDAYQRAALPETELWIGGKIDSGYASGLQSKTRADGSIRWLGYTNPDVFFRDIDVLVVPSLWNDTAPLVILEAQSHGIPVLGANRGGIPELVPAGTGWLYDPGNDGALAAGLRECVRASRDLDAIQHACRTHALQAAASPWAEAYVQAYENSLKA
jgi:glycosyltransferase involved in cell wall biosynthesis